MHGSCPAPDRQEALVLKHGGICFKEEKVRKEPQRVGMAVAGAGTQVGSSSFLLTVSCISQIFHNEHILFF